MAPETKTRKEITRPPYLVGVHNIGLFLTRLPSGLTAIHWGTIPTEIVAVT